MWSRLKVTLHSPIKQVATDWRGRKLLIKAWILQHLNSFFSFHVCSKKCNFDHFTIYMPVIIPDIDWFDHFTMYYYLYYAQNWLYLKKKTHDTVTHWVFEIHLFKIFSTQDSAASPSHLLELRNLNLFAELKHCNFLAPFLVFFKVPSFPSCYYQHMSFSTYFQILSSFNF